jgi:hypothetical protein
MIGGGHNAQSDKNATEADAFAEGMRPTLAELEELSAYRVSIILNKRGVPSATGGRWTPSQVTGVCRRLARLAER